MQSFLNNNYTNKIPISTYPAFAKSFGNNHNKKSGNFAYWNYRLKSVCMNVIFRLCDSDTF